MPARVALDAHAHESEVAADEAASRDGHLGALAAALLAFDARGASVHPHRVDRLLGERADARMPIASILITAVTIAALAATGLAGATSNGHDYPLVAVPAVLVATAVAAAVMVAPPRLLSGVVAWRLRRRPR